MYNNIWSVYIHRNILNNKVYVGVTSWKPEKRWGCRGYRYNSQEKFYSAIKKYGWDNFEHIIVEKNLNKDEALEMEVELIKKYNSIYCGYNVTKGGEGSTGVVLSQEVKDRISEQKKGKYLGSENANAKTIICLNNRYLFTTILNAAKYGGVSDSHISAVCKGNKKYSGRDPLTNEYLKWMYYNDYIKLYGVVNEPIIDSYIPHKNYSKVVCLDNGQVFETIPEADRFSNAHGHIKACCEGKRKTAGGYRWMYYEDYILNNDIAS